MRVQAVLLLWLLWLPVTALAGTFDLRPGLSVVLPELPAPWVVSKQAPDPMVEHLAGHLQEEVAAKGQTLPAEAAAKAARERLAGDELFLFNPQTDAHVQISFSELQKDEAEPDAAAIRLSARYAASGVGDEGWNDVKQQHNPVTLKGAKHAQRFDIEYTHDGEPSSFMGIVGYARPFWFWVYGSDHQKDKADRQVIETVLKEIEIRSNASR